jgi:hypothetical protein
MPDGILDRGRRVGIPGSPDLSLGVCARCCALTGPCGSTSRSTSSVRERTGVAGRPAMLVEKGYRAATLSDRRCPVLSVVVGGDVAPIWPQGTRRARPARTNRAPVWRRWSQAQPEGESVQDDHLPRWQAAGAARQGGASVAAGERPPRPPDGGRRGLGPPSPAGRYRPADRDQRPGQPAAACPGDRTANLLDTVATREFLSASAGGAYGELADPFWMSEGSEQSPHDLVGLLGLIGTPGPPRAWPVDRVCQFGDRNQRHPSCRSTLRCWPRASAP